MTAFDPGVDLAAVDATLAAFLDAVGAGRTPMEAVADACSRTYAKLRPGDRYGPLLALAWLVGVDRRGDDARAAASDARTLILLCRPAAGSGAA